MKYVIKKDSAYNAIIFFILAVSYGQHWLTPLFAFVSILLWAVAVVPWYKTKSVLERILVAFKYIWQYYAIVATIIVILFTLFVWAFENIENP